MTTQITLATVEATLRNTITNDGTILVRLSEECLAQMNDIVARVKTVSKYDETKLDEEQLEIAYGMAQRFTNESIGTKFVDGYLALEDQARVDEILGEMEEHLKDCPVGFIAPVILVNKILNEVKYFAV